ncbi:MAG: MFS transporter [Firmicutes bacterium]|nr:MFS transporter [Bacillota bacterium]
MISNEMKMKLSKWRRWGILAVLSMGGGIIYILPYLSCYFYIPMKEAMHLNNTQLGLMGSALGIAAMILYWPGGWVADRFSPRKLVTLSLSAVGLLGLWMATFPPFKILIVIQLLMGVFTTLTFWSAMIKATRQLGSSTEQGRFFGFLEAGRNLITVVVVAGALALFAKMGSNAIGLRWAIILLSVGVFIIALLSWFSISDQQEVAQEESSDDKEQVPLWEGITRVVKLPAVWMVMLIILSAYVTSVGITYITPYATDVYKQSVVFGGLLYTIMEWTSIFASPVAGFIADRITTSKATIYSFIILVLSWSIFVFVKGGASLYYVLLVNSIVIGCTIYGLRGIYYALLEEGAIPRILTGTATGLISFIAYTPDVFIPYVAGRLLDKYPGGLGYKYFFLILALFSVFGLILTVIFRKTVSVSGTEKPVA